MEPEGTPYIRNPFIENAWRWNANMPEVKEPHVHLDYEELKRSEWNPEFEAYMRNRMVMGAFRYGRMSQLGKPKYDNIGSAIERLKAYGHDHNTEHLIDAANLCMVEFTIPKYPDAHFVAVDDGEHTKAL